MAGINSPLLCTQPQPESHSLVLYLDADDYIEYKLWHNAGEDCDVNGDYNSVQAWRILGAV